LPVPVVADRVDRRRSRLARYPPQPRARCRPGPLCRAPTVVAVNTQPTGLPTSAAQATLSRIMTTLDTNLLGTVHGGVIMKLVDDVAGVVAQRHSGGPAVTASMDEMAFLEPVRVGDLVHAHGRVNWTGRTSLEVGVRVLAEPWNELQTAKRVATAYLVFVALDSDGRPRHVTPVLPETEEDRRRFAEAEIRRTHRLARREAILRSRGRSDR
jgi:acyl-CoA hydrolase